LFRISFIEVFLLSPNHLIPGPSRLA